MLGYAILKIKVMCGAHAHLRYDKRLYQYCIL